MNRKSLALAAIVSIADPYVYSGHFRPDASADLMVFSLMTVNAHEVIAPHVNIKIFSGEIQCRVQITMLNTITAAAIKVTTTTVISIRRTDTLRGCQ